MGVGGLACTALINANVAKYILSKVVGIKKRACQDYGNDVRIIISTSLNFSQIRKNGLKRPKLQFLESAQPAPKKRLDLHIK